MRQYSIKLDMKQPSTQQTSIVLNQANVDSVGFNIKIFQDAAEINYLSYSGAEMVFLKPDKNNVVDDNVILSSAGIGYTLRPELFQAPGMITGYVNLYSGEVIAATLYFKFMVVSDLLKLETISKSYLAVIERLFSDVSNLWNVMDQLSAEMEAIREKIDSI